MNEFDYILTGYDIHLFNQGTHYEIYRKLGSHACENRGISGVHFAVWAPHAASVSVAGTFNSWDESANVMILRSECGVWELFIPGIKEGSLYKYFIRTSEGTLLYKSDPFSSYNELRPATASVIFNSDYVWNDSEFMKKRMERKVYEEPVSIYEVHAGSWRRKPDGSFLSYRELADVLPDYAVECGFTHIELMPVMEHPYDGSWGYQITGYFAPTSRFGNPDDFRYFIDVCHGKGLGVILDWVPAHFPSDESGLLHFDGTPLYEYADPRIGFHGEWSTHVFDYSKNEVRNFLIANALYWIEEFHADGLRVDAVASMLYLDYGRQDYIRNIYGGNGNLEAVSFFQTLAKEIFSRHEGIIFAAEESTAWPGVTAPVENNGLGFGFKWNMGWMNDFLEYVSTDPLHRKYNHDKLTFSMEYAYSENYILPLSHDEVVHCKNSLSGRMPGDRKMKFSGLKTALAHMFTHPGKKLIFMGGEIAQQSEWNHDSQIDWNLLREKEHAQLHFFFRTLNMLYRSRPALYAMDYDPAGFRWVINNDNDCSVIAYIRHGKEISDTLLVVLNFTPVTRRGYRVGVPHDCFWKEILNSDSDIFGGSGEGNKGGFINSKVPSNGMEYSLELTLPGLGALIFEPVFDNKN
ncbi:MAG: 1,4-alpha-glucan branching protein GlgB [Spirochaetes bacterium]|nr:1,4-alpha-glucan branching protein GlgB [Spirochaetota bacterium]